MSVRHASADDARQIAEVHVASWRQAYADLMSRTRLQSQDLDKRTRIWTRILEENQSECQVSVRDDRIVGFISTGPCRDSDKSGTPDTLDTTETDVAEIYALYLQPDCWRQGLGSELLQASLATLDRTRWRELTLWVLDGNHRAQRFYEHFGFTADGETKSDPAGDQTEIRYVRSHQ